MVYNSKYTITDFIGAVIDLGLGIARGVFDGLKDILGLDDLELVLVILASILVLVAVVGSLAFKWINDHIPDFKR